MNFMNNRQKGELGEQIALDYLLKNGYQLIEKNWHYSKSAEIDLIVKKADTIVFVEVKTRSNLKFGHPFEAITKTKMQNIKKAVTAYLSSNPNLKFKNIRIDGIAIIGAPSKIEHLKNLY